MRWFTRAATDRRKVFVSCGRDEEVRECMFDLLRALDLKPLEWEPMVAVSGSAAPFLADVVRRAPVQAQATIVLLTPDDIVQLHPRFHLDGMATHKLSPACQPRPNVLIELGLALMAAPGRTLVVEIGNLRPIADLGGRNVVRFDGSPAAVGKLVERLKSAGCAVDDQGSDWRSPHRFQSLDAYRRGPSADQVWAVSRDRSEAGRADHTLARAYGRAHSAGETSDQPSARRTEGR